MSNGSYSVEAVTNSILRALKVPANRQISCEHGCPHRADEYVTGLVAHACMEASEAMLIAWEKRRQNGGSNGQPS